MSRLFKLFIKDDETIDWKEATKILKNSEWEEFLKFLLEQKIFSEIENENFCIKTLKAQEILNPYLDRKPLFFITRNEALNFAFQKYPDDDWQIIKNKEESRPCILQILIP